MYAKRTKSHQFHATDSIKDTHPSTHISNGISWFFSWSKNRNLSRPSPMKNIFFKSGISVFSIGRGSGSGPESDLWFKQKVHQRVGIENWFDRNSISHFDNSAGRIRIQTVDWEKSLNFRGRSSLDFNSNPTVESVFAEKMQLRRFAVRPESDSIYCISKFHIKKPLQNQLASTILFYFCWMLFIEK